MTDTPKELLDVVERKQLLARERLQPGMIDVLVLLLATSAAAGITGAYDANRLIGIPMTVVSAVIVGVLLRSRMRLGGRIAVATWAIPAVLFVADMVIGLAFEGSGRDYAMALSLPAAAAVLGFALRSWFIVGIGTALAVIFAGGLAFFSGGGSLTSSVASFGLGIAFGAVAFFVQRKRLAKR